MSDAALLALGVFELTGLVALFVLVRRGARRRAAGHERPARFVRLSIALLGLLVVLVFPVVMIGSIVNPSIQADRQHRRLVQTGTPAIATITDIEETGTVINRRPQVQVSMFVEPPDAPGFSAQSTWVFSVKDTQTYRVGTRVNVFFDPEDRGSVAVVGVAPTRE